MIPGVFNEGRDKAFFFWGQEFYVYNQSVNSTQRVPSERMRQGDFSELLGPNIFYSTPRQIVDPLTGQPFPGNVIPQDRLSPNGMAFLNAFPDPTPGYLFSNNNWTLDDVQEPRQRKDTLRLDFVPSAQAPAHAAGLALQLEAARRLPQRLPVRAHRLGPAEQVGRPVLAVDDLPGHDQRDDGRLRQGHRQDPRLHRGRPVRPHAATGSTTPTSSRARRSRTRSRRSRSGSSRTRSTAGRTRPPRPAPSTPSRTPSPTCGAGTRSRSAPTSSTRGRTTSTRSTCRPTCPATPTTRTAASSSTTGGREGPGPPSRTPPSASSRTTRRSASAPTPSTGPGRWTSSPRTPGR